MVLKNTIIKLTFLFFLVFSVPFYAQNVLETDTIKKNYEKKATFHLDRAAEVENVDSVNYHAKKSLYYAKLSKNDTLLMYSYNTMSHAIKIKYDYNLAEEYSQKCLSLAKKFNDDYVQFLCYNLLGIIKSTEKQYQLSTEYYKNALSFAKKKHDTINISLLYHNIALNYYFTEEFDLAKLFLRKSENTYNSIKIFKDPSRKDSDYIYLQMKKSLVADTKEEALSFVDMAIDRAKKINYNFHVSLSYKYKGRVFVKYNEYNSAIENFQKAIAYEKIANTKSSDSYVEIMNALVKAKKYRIAKKYMDTLFQHFSDRDIRPMILDKYKVISEIYQNLGNLNMALFYANKRATVSDSLLKHNNYTLFAEFGKQFETKEKEKEIIKQQLVIERKDNEKKNIILFGGMAAFLGLLFFQWKFNSQKNRKKNAESAFEKEREFNVMRTSFLENISHEIRTPLTLINGYLNLINEEATNHPKIKEYVKNALFNSKKVIFDADEILNLLKFEDKKLSLNIVSEHLNEFLEQLFLSFKVLATTRNIELIYTSNIPNACNVEMDIVKIERILTNLISNAIKFSNSNSKVLFDAHAEGKVLSVSIIDFGQGIEKDDIEHIFTRFYQSKNNKSVGGIGIGLLLAKEFATFLGGNLTVKSKVGKGSTFTLTLPIFKDQFQKECKTTPLTQKKNLLVIETKNHLDKAVIDSKKPSILIVEDSIEMSNYLKEILSPFYNCAFAFDGLEGLNLAKKQRFDLVASDVMMPKIDGYKFKELLKSLPDYHTIPFILITAKSLPEDKIKGFSIGIDDYITKPFLKEELIIRISNLLRNSNELKLSIRTPDTTLNEISETHIDKLLKEIENEILTNLSNENFKVEDLALKMNYSQRQLARILNRHTGLSTVKFILEIKLREAYKLIENNTFKTISEVQYAVGITSSSYFSDKFKNRFGINPSELMRK